MISLHAIEIIDTHVHTWDLSKAEYSWLKGDTSIINRTFLLDELDEQRLTAGINGGVLVQADNNFEDTDYMLQVASKNNWIKGLLVGYHFCSRVSLNRFYLRRILKILISKEFVT
jgi:L-fuconolactonase